MEKISKLRQVIREELSKHILNENDRAYGHEAISNLYSKLKDDEYVELDDSSGDLSGSIVSKIEYVKNLLKKAIDKKDWGSVHSAISFIDTQIK